VVVVEGRMLMALPEIDLMKAVGKVSLRGIGMFGSILIGVSYVSM
jgi:ABC-type iron transport system FetAB permease component